MSWLSFWAFLQTLIFRTVTCQIQFSQYKLSSCPVKGDQSPQHKPFSMAAFLCASTTVSPVSLAFIAALKCYFPWISQNQIKYRCCLVFSINGAAIWLYNRIHKKNRRQEVYGLLYRVIEKDGRDLKPLKLKKYWTDLHVSRLKMFRKV